MANKTLTVANSGMVAIHNAVMKKRSFLLLEILIAFSLVAICILPFVKGPLDAYLAELKSLQILEKERLADLAFCEIKELLFKNEIPWKKIPVTDATTPPFPLKNAVLQIPGSRPKIIKRAFTLKCRCEKLGGNGQIYRQLEVMVYLDQNKYEFRLPVQKL